MGLAFAISW